MNILRMLEAITSYLTEGFMMIFSPQENELPEIGVQPFECVPYSESR
ncbi:MAG: hypothetical protein ACXITR_10140 [Cyanobacterium sp.]